MSIKFIFKDDSSNSSTFLEQQLQPNFKIFIMLKYIPIYGQIILYYSYLYCLHGRLEYRDDECIQPLVLHLDSLHHLHIICHMRASYILYLELQEWSDHPLG